MEITSDQVDSSATGACLALRFLFNPKQQQVSRNQLPDLSDSAIFHRLWDLFGLVDPATTAHLNTTETEALENFMRCYNSLPWEAIADKPHIAQLLDDDLSPLTPVGKLLYDQLIRRQNISWWKRLTIKLRGW